MNVVVTPAVADLLRAEQSRAEALANVLPIPPQPVEAYADPEYLTTYDGIAVYRLRNGFIYDHETGCSWSVEHAAAKIDEWRARRERERLEEGPADPPGEEW